MIKVEIYKNYEELSEKAGQAVAEVIKNKPDCVLGLATGSSPVGLYKYLISEYKKGNLDFSKVTSVNLDEYKGLPGTHDQSYRYFMNDNLFDHVNINKDRTFVPDGMTSDPEKMCQEYDEMIEKLGGQDVQVLGIGPNGHIAFNEPDSFLIWGTHETKLTDATIEANKRFFASKDDVPRAAFTMGIGSIFKAKKIVVVANGTGKAKAVKTALSGKLDPMCPVSFLQLHPDVTFFIDKDAASEL